MKIQHPFRPRGRIELTSAEEQRLAKLHQEFIGKLQSLPEERQRAVIRTTAAGMVLERRRADDGTKEVFKPDAYTRSLAQQMLDVLKANERIKAAQDEIADINRKRPDERKAFLERREELQEAINQDLARVLAIRERDHTGAREQAALEFRDAEAQEAKANALLAEVERQRAEAAAADVERRARAIVNAERGVTGEQDA